MSACFRRNGDNLHRLRSSHAMFFLQPGKRDDILEQTPHSARCQSTVRTICFCVRIAHATAEGCGRDSQTYKSTDRTRTRQTTTPPLNLSLSRTETSTNFSN